MSADWLKGPIPNYEPSLASTSLLQCLSNSTSPFIILTDPQWPTYATTFNERLQYIPAAISIPNSTEQVTAAVNCASRYGIPVQAKSGGHSYASYSTGGRNGILMIDLENFNSISLNNRTGVAAVGGGVRLGDLAQGIWDQGRRALGHGTCPGVGIGGHFTHGGYGYSSRAFGLALEQITGLDVVLANGSFVKVDNETLVDVYYALRGAADSFGIVTTFYLQTWVAPEVVINFSYSFPQALASVENATAAFMGVQNFSLSSPVVDRNLGLGVTIGGNATSYLVHGTYFGSIETFNKTIAPALLEAIPFAPALNESSVEPTDWITSLTMLGGEGNLTVPLHGFVQQDNFYAKSVTANVSFTEEPIRKFFQYAYSFGRGENAPVSWFSIINLYGGPDSQIGAEGRNESWAAYAGFDDLWVVQNYGNVPLNQIFPQRGIQFLDGLNDAMTKAMNGSYNAYLNYIDPELDRDEAWHLYYGQSLFQRLKSLKREIDPGDVFWNPQSIPVWNDTWIDSSR
ncbi:putative glucooligosaccharide oxidase [Triangularia verruculosa]|uniref:Glucooligosaccharide oxidase n=1 Tax=Triangularia verruculosa TaxID=2587418 RepID=A0AAN6XL38_9PEZI|nr:putative glucooligosaccharide oxidase [Triangularia verruculosa]